MVSTKDAPAVGEAAEPGAREPAPGDLAIVQAFVNTNDIESGVDELADPEALRTWLARRGLMRPDSPTTDADLRVAVSVREALRDLALADAAAGSRAASALNRVARRSRCVVRFEADGGARLEPEPDGVDGALGALLGIVYTAMAEDTWSRLKACRNDGCRWLFYDRSKNRSGAWCTMAVCGNREKARAYRRRRRGREPGP